MRRFLQARRARRLTRQRFEREYRAAVTAHDVACRHHAFVCQAFALDRATYGATLDAFEATIKAFIQVIAASRALYEAELRDMT